MVILIDANILLDFLQKRKPFMDAADEIIHKCAAREIVGYIAAHSITNAFYILRKDYPAEERKAMLLDLCYTVNVVGIDRQKLVSALLNERFDDIEDCLQTECARAVGADYIVTRNIADFANSTIPAVLPDDFLRNTMPSNR